jgi:hypothetical protein
MGRTRHRSRTDPPCAPMIFAGPRAAWRKPGLALWSRMRGIALLVSPDAPFGKAKLRFPKARSTASTKCKSAQKALEKRALRHAPLTEVNRV